MVKLQWTTDPSTSCCLCSSQGTWAKWPTRKHQDAFSSLIVRSVDLPFADVRMQMRSHSAIPLEEYWSTATHKQFVIYESTNHNEAWSVVVASSQRDVLAYRWTHVSQTNLNIRKCPIIINKRTVLHIIITRGRSRESVALTKVSVAISAMLTNDEKTSKRNDFWRHKSRWSLPVKIIRDRIDELNRNVPTTSITDGTDQDWSALRTVSVLMAIMNRIPARNDANSIHRSRLPCFCRGKYW